MPDLASIRITAIRPDGTVVDRLVEIENTQRLETALAKAWADVLGRPCVAREAADRKKPGKNCVTLHAYEGPRAAGAGGPPPEAVAASRVIGRFEVVRANGRRKLVGTWYGADGEVVPAAGRG